MSYLKNKWVLVAVAVVVALMFRNEILGAMPTSVKSWFKA